MIPSHPLAELFPLIEGADFAALVADITTRGLVDKIAILDGAILDGRNRYRALLAAGLADEEDGPDRSLYFRRFLPEIDGEPLAYVISKNLNRRHLDESQRAFVAAKLANLGHGGARRAVAYADAAPSEAAPHPDPLPSTSAVADVELTKTGGEREMCAFSPLPVNKERSARVSEPGEGRDAGGGGDIQAANLPLETVTQAEAARLLAVSERSLRSAKAVQEHGTPELQAAVERGRLAVSAAAQAARLAPEMQRAVAAVAESGRANAVRTALKTASRAQREQALAQTLCALPDKRYGVIYADPEWRFEPRSRESGLDRAADNHYPTSPTAAIAAREVGAIAAADSVLFLWATAPMLPDALTVMAAWGFAYKSHLVWHKQRPGAGRGAGYWFTGEHELLLVGTRGRLPAPATALCGSVVAAPVGAHSQKPASFAELIERAFPSLPKIELNARAVRPGWDAWGNEAESVVTESRANASDGMAAMDVPPGAAAGGVSDDASRLAGGRTPVSTAAEWDAAQTSATGVTAGETAPLDLPDFLRRGADNRAPFMHPRRVVERSEAQSATRFGSAERGAS